MAGKRKKRSSLTQLALAARAGRNALSSRLAEIDLYAGQDAVLLLLDTEDGLSLRDLADRLAVRPPTITKTMARLATQGFIEKRASDTDARQSHAFLTENGRGVVEQVKAAQKAVEKAALRDFSEKEKKLLRKLLHRVEANLVLQFEATESRKELEAE